MMVLDWMELTLAVALTETLDATSGVDEFLLACKKRMTGVANLQPQLLLGGVGLEGVAASASSGYQMKLGMNVFPHGLNLLIGESWNSPLRQEQRRILNIFPGRKHQRDPNVDDFRGV